MFRAPYLEWSDAPEARKASLLILHPTPATDFSMQPKELPAVPLREASLIPNLDTDLSFA